MDDHAPDVGDTDYWNRPPSGSPDQYRAYHPPDSPGKLSTTIVHALADAMGISVTETGFSLFDCIDPDALNRIFSTKANGTPRPTGHVTFYVQGYRVTVYGDGQILITPPSHPRA